MTTALFSTPDTPPHPLAVVAVVWLHPAADEDASRQDRPGLPFTCGTCVHRVTVRGYPKCDVDWPARTTRSRSTDVRGWWPACGDYEPTKEPQ